MREKFCIIESDDVKDRKIREYLDQHSLATFYHLPEYVKILANESNQKLMLLICLNDKDSICGYLPLVTTRGIPFNIGAPLTSKRISSLPRTPICGPLYNNEEVLKLLLSHAIFKIQLDKNLILQIKSNEKLDEHLSNIQSFFWRRSFIKEIVPKGEQIRYRNTQIEKEVYRFVRKAEREGIQFYEAQNSSDLESWYKIYLENARFHVSFARSKNFFKDLWNEFHPRGMMKINLILNRNNLPNSPLSGSLNFRYKNQVWGGYKGRSIKNYLKFADDVLHYYEFIQAQNDNYRIFDLGEVAEYDMGLENYKKKWGVNESKIFHNYYSCNNIKFKSDLDSSKHLIINRIWKSIPLSITSIIGRRINNLL